MVVGEASIHNIMGGMMSTGGVRLHNHKRKLKQRFDIIKKLGQGTYGKVQLGINKETGQEVAIKTIKKCKIETEADLIRIRREIQIMSSVQHPNIIHIYEVFENREKMVLVMEYAAGGELYDYLSKRKVLTEEEARRIFRQIATAVFYCHKHKICHRDLKLENILLDQLGNAKIADFGLSNVFDEQRLLNTFCGSPLYASPEIVKGTPYHGPEVDCWSLGVLLYTLVYGAMPFDGSNFKRLVKQISQSDYFEPKKPSPASPLIKDMLTVSPVKRADIERICTHWWVNEGYEQNCLDIAEELAAQTPVRLDLLLSLVPQSASAEKLVIGDQQPGADVANSASSEALPPTRCHSVGSLMELDRDSSDRRIRELLEEEPRSPPGGGDAKRKLETTPSMDETAAAGAKRKDRPKRKERRDEKDGRVYKSVSRHHSAPIPNSITEEAMEVDPVVTVPIDDTADASKLESAAAACLDLIKECSERSPSKERSKTPVILEQEQSLRDGSAESPSKNCGRGEREEDGARGDEASELTLDRSVATVPLESETLNEVAAAKDRLESASFAGQEAINLEETHREFKKLKEKALSLDSELPISESREIPPKTFERRRSKIFETAEKFNQMASSVENEKPKKIFIPGVNVGGAKRVFERKASLSSIATPPPAKAAASKVIIDVSRSTPSTPVASVAPVEAKRNDETKRPERKEEEQVEQVEEVEHQRQEGSEEEKKKEEARKRAVDIITGAIGKPPVQKRVNGSPPVSPSSQEPRKLPLKIPVGTNDSRTATVSVSTPVETKFPFADKATVAVARTEAPAEKKSDAQPEEPKMSSKMEITLKSATLPRPRKTSKAEISLSGVKPFGCEATAAFKSEVEAKVDAFHPQKLRTQRSEVAFPVAAAVPHANRSSSLEPEGKPRNATPKERIIPIQVETEQRQHSSTPPPSKPPPMPQRSLSQRSGSLSRQSTADSDTDSALGSTVGPEPIRKSPREYIIPIAVEGGGYVTPRSGSVEPESKASGTPTTGTAASTVNATRPRFGRPRRMSSLLSDASEDESPFSSLHRDSEDLLQRHMHRLRSSRPSRQPPEHADSLSSGEDDDDDGFELLTAENLFSTLLSRVRSLTQRLNVDDNRTAGFPSSRLFARLGSNSSQPFWPINKPLSRRLSESQFRHSLGRDADALSRKDSTNSSSNPGTPSSPGSHGASTRDTVYDIGISTSTLPRDKVAREDVEAEPARARKGAHESLEQSFTPSLARRLSRTLIEQTRRSLTRSPSASYETRSRSPGAETAASFQDASEAADRSVSTISTVSTVSTVSDRSEHRERPAGSRVVGRSSSLLEPSIGRDASRGSPRRSLSLFDDESHARDYDESGSSGSSRWYRDSSAGKLRKDSFRSRRADKIQEETTADDAGNGSLSEYTNPLDATSSLSTKSYESSPTESSSNIGEYGKGAYRSDLSRNFEDRMLAAENLIKESKLRNLGGTPGSGAFDQSYRDAEKGDARSLITIAETNSSSALSKRRSCIPSLRLRSGSLTRDSSAIGERRKSFADSRDAVASAAARALGTEKSLLRKLFKSAGVGETDSKEDKAKEREKSKQRRISRFLRPDFFDTPREESRYVKEKEAQKAAENERRKSRFIRRKTENSVEGEEKCEEKGEEKSEEKSEEKREEKREKEAKNEINSLRRERLDGVEESSRNGFLHSLEKKLERLRATDGQVARAGATNGRVENEATRERSAPPVDCRPALDADTVKRAVSVEDLSATKKSGQSTAKSRVSSVLGLFKSTDAKQRANGGRSPSKPKRSPTKSAKPADAALAEDASSSSCGSKIPTKHLSADPKPTRKLVGVKRPDKPASSASSASDSPKRSPAKDAPEKQDRGSSTREKNASSEKEPKENSVQAGKPEDADKKAKKTMKKSAASSEGGVTDTAKKKRIVRVVRKVTNKSGDGEAGKAAPEEKDKSTKARTTKKSHLKEEAAAREAKEAKEAEETARQSKLQESQRAIRSNLKLDLSKIPQHSFRNSAPKSDSPKSTANDHGPDKLMECLSKVTHRASIAGSKIIIDKPLRAKDVAELKKEVTECARIIESHAESARAANVPENRPPVGTEEATRGGAAATGSTENQRASCAPLTKDSPVDCTNELLSPMDEPESFDSWSISSTEMSHARPDLHSPTSPAHSGFGKGDNAESVIDRIRRRSFYTRFNDRRRPSLTAPPPGVTLPSSATLPRKFSFTGQQREHRDQCRGKYGAGYGLTTGGKVAEAGIRATNRSTYSLHGQEAGPIGRDRSLDRGIDRSRYSDSGYSPDLNAKPELVPGLCSSSSYDPLRRYLRSPTFERPASRSRYHSADFVADPDLAACYRSPLISSMNDAAIDTHLSAFSTLPRNYGTSVPGPKTVQYYEELLAPSCADYLPSRRTPAPSEYLSKSENGYYNGGSELRSNGPKRKPYAERATASVDTCDDESPEQKRDKEDAACDAGAFSTPAEATIGRAGD